MKSIFLLAMVLLAGCVEGPPTQWSNEEAAYIGRVKSFTYIIGDGLEIPMIQAGVKTFLLSYTGSARAKDIEVGNRVWTISDTKGTRFILIELPSDKGTAKATVFWLRR